MLVFDFDELDIVLSDDDKIRNFQFEKMAANDKRMSNDLYWMQYL